MIAPDTINISTLPSLVLSDRRRLPNVSAVYIVLEGETVIYVGRSARLVSRWDKHHKLKQFESRASVKIAWIEQADANLLPAIKKSLINYFQPELNGYCKKSKAKKTEVIQIMVEPEIKKGFNAWCIANSTTMSEFLREKALLYVQEGKELLDVESIAS